MSHRPFWEPAEDWRPVTGEPALSFVEHFQLRVLQDAMADATAAYWLRRAEQLQAARPRHGDYPGRATAAELAAAYQHLTEAAQACRRRAQVEDVTRGDFADAMDWVAGSAA